VTLDYVIGLNASYRLACCQAIIIASAYSAVDAIASAKATHEQGSMMSVNVRLFNDTLPVEGRESIVFAHANGYPPGSYRLMLTSLAEHFNVYIFDHRPLWSTGEAPTRLAWSAYASDLIDGLEEAFDGPVWLCGHSMGAVVSVLCARRRPGLVKGLIALDPVLLPLGLWLAAQFVSRFLRKDLPICHVALNRPHSFDSFDAAFKFYRAKKPFRNLADEALWDYVRAGHRETRQGDVELIWSGAWEACIYRSAPSVFGVLSRVKQPMLGIAGLSSDVLTARRLKKWRRTVGQLEQHVLAGGHLVPLEKPEECVVLITQYIGRHSRSDSSE